MSHGAEEHLEHVHHAHDPFDRRVAMTIAIVAAVLACVTMLSHRAHNETLRLQTQVDIQHNKASNEWNYFQAKKNRQYLYEACEELATVTAKDAGDPDARKKAADYIKDWKTKVDKYKEETEQIKTKAEGFLEKAEEFQSESDHCHHVGTRLDLGELGVELALVLCSVAVLTKRNAFWHVGIGFAILGVVVAATVCIQ